MCVLLSIYKKNKDNSNNVMLTRKIIELATRNHDGIAMVGSFHGSKDVEEFHSLTATHKKVYEFLEKFDQVDIHMRFATTGTVSVENTHFWKIADWRFAHNGTVPKFSGKDSDLVDSYIFFRQLHQVGALKQNGYMRLKKVAGLVKDTNLWGRFLLTNRRNHKAYFYGNFHTYLINENVLVVASQTLDFDPTIDFMGLKFKSSDKILKGDFDGLLCIDTRDLKSHFKSLDKKFPWQKGGTYDHNYGNYSYHNRSDDWDRNSTDSSEFTVEELAELDKEMREDDIKTGRVTKEIVKTVIELPQPNTDGKITLSPND